MKKFICCLFIVLSMFILPACAQVECYTKFSGKDSVSMAISTTVDGKIITQAHNEDPNSPTIETVNEAILNVLKAEKQTIDEHLRVLKVTTELQEKTDGDKFTKILVVNFERLADYQVGLSYLWGDEAINELSNKTDDLPEVAKRKSWLTKKATILKIDNAFDINYAVLEKLETEFKKLGLTKFDTEKDVNFIQIISYPNGNVKSNATKVIKNGNETIHIFQMKKSEMKNKDIYLYFQYPVFQNWYFLALIITAIFIIVYVIVALTWKRNKKDKNIQILEDVINHEQINKDTK